LIEKLSYFFDCQFKRIDSYVADWDNNRIQKFDSNGNFITKWGTVGTGDGQFMNPAALAADSYIIMIIVKQQQQKN
jgi:DNA-binding beta-propeller fold protein YncE